MDNSYVEISIKTNVENLDIISNAFYKLGCFEISVEDPRDLDMESYINLDAYFEDDELYKYGKGIGVIKYYISNKENVNEFANSLKSIIASYDISYDLNFNNINEEDWANNWKKYYNTFKVNDKIVIKPEWEDYTPNGEEIIINIDPGMAFGTGTHETTKLCMNLIYKYMKPGFIAYDIGTGSGILSILLARLNAEKIVAIDLDVVAVSAAKHNIELNNISNIEVLHGNLLDKATFKADIVVANIIAEVISILIPDILKVVKEDGLFIASGIIKDKCSLIRNEFEKYGFYILEEVCEGEWFAFVVKVK